MHSHLAAEKPVHLVDTPAALSICLQYLWPQATIALDLEFDSHSYSYGVTLCLIQIATSSACYLIDPFAAIDLGGVYAVLEDERIQKIMHSPGEDLRLLHSLQCYPKNVFDTEAVARLLNYEQTSLAVMLQEKLGHTMSKKQQRSNWLLRPLTPEQKEYAAADVASLHALKEALEPEAIKAGLMPFVLDEQAALSTTIHQPEVKTFFLKPADLYTLSPYDQHVLNAFLAYRDSFSRQLNKPAYKVMDEGIARALASGTLQPRDLPDTKGINPVLKNSRTVENLAKQLKAIRAEADSRRLSMEAPGRQRFTPEERAAKDLAERDRIKKFAPVQSVLAARYGEFAARYMLSNGQVSDILSGKTTIAGLKQSYRKTLITGIAAELGIDLKRYM